MNTQELLELNRHFREHAVAACEFLRANRDDLRELIDEFVGSESPPLLSYESAELAFYALVFAEATFNEIDTDDALKSREN